MVDLSELMASLVYTAGPRASPLYTSLPISPLISVPHSPLLCEGHTSPAMFAFLFPLPLSAPAVVGLDGHACKSLFRKDPPKWEMDLQSRWGLPVQSLGKPVCTCRLALLPYQPFYLQSVNSVGLTLALQPRLNPSGPWELQAITPSLEL